MTKIYKKGINIKMNKKKENITKLKTIKVDEDTHRDLKIYTATNKLKTMGDSVRDLLDKVPDGEK